MPDDELFTLPPSYQEVQQSARQLAAEVAALEIQSTGRFAAKVRSALASSGLTRLVVPEAYGGSRCGPDSLAITLVREALAAESAHLDSMFAMQGIGSFALARAGSPELAARWLPAVGRMEAVPALALTEPHIGSDLKQLSTTIEPCGEKLVVTGSKSFITNAGEADFYCVLGREGEGYSLVLVPADASGLEVSRPYQVMDDHVIGDVQLSGVTVPSSYRIGAPGDGFDHVLATLATFRVSVAGAAIGVAQAALQEAIDHASSREMFGTTLARLGGVPEKLARSWTEIEAARSLAYRAAAAAMRDPVANLHLSSTAKVVATETTARVVDTSVQLMGRFGLIKGSRIDRLQREARPMRIYEGSTEVILDSLARYLLKTGLR